MVQEAQYRTGFNRPIYVEKDFYLSLLLKDLNAFNKDLVFHGGTCLNKIYYPYFRLSEDLDFNIKINYDQKSVIKSDIPALREKIISPINQNLGKYVEKYGLRLDQSSPYIFTDNQQYDYSIIYPSVYTGKDEIIKLEIGVRTNPVQVEENHKIQHCFINQATKEPHFTYGEVKALSKKETVAEKLCCLALRAKLKIRDLYDLDYILIKEPELIDKEVLKIFEIKILEQTEQLRKWDGFKVFAENMGRKKEEIEYLRSRVEPELHTMLIDKEIKRYNIDLVNDTFNKINNIMSNYSSIETLLTPEEREKHLNQYLEPENKVKEIDELNQYLKEVKEKNDSEYNVRDIKGSLEKMKEKIKDIKKIKNKSKENELEI